MYCVLIRQVTSMTTHRRRGNTQELPQYPRQYNISWLFVFIHSLQDWLWHIYSMRWNSSEVHLARQCNHVSQINLLWVEQRKHHGRRGIAWSTSLEPSRKVGESCWRSAMPNGKGRRGTSKETIVAWTWGWGIVLYLFIVKYFLTVVGSRQKEVHQNGRWHWHLRHYPTGRGPPPSKWTYILISGYKW